MSQFRFQDFTIWQNAIELTDELFDLADNLEADKKFRFAEQLRGAVMSITNNISEGAGSNSKKDFARFLSYSRKSCFETANILILMEKRGYMSFDILAGQLAELEILSKMITNFRKSLLNN
ncbi:four helix bundle protein [Fodinibius sp.]|uniref:four helix bundle protein n=1 Tax=Fodinibius sp. TaxID=1872440 RepID=UPI002ACDA5D4|nr:four helix bundle protein [Fodinibius sp.]MDZ7660665.1 four helix bundle protein [Fodinibius sp.]